MVQTKMSYARIAIPTISLLLIAVNSMACSLKDSSYGLEDVNGTTARERFAARMENLGIDPTVPLNDAIWQSLGAEQQVQLIEITDHMKDDYWEGMKTINFRHAGAREIRISQIFYSPYREIAEQIDGDMRDVVNMDVMDTDGSHSVIGSPQIRWLTYLVRISDHKVFGAKVGYYQQGCDMPDFDGDIRSFTTVQEAEAAGCDLSDVNWQAYGVYGPAAARLRYSDDYLEWSGY